MSSRVEFHDEPTSRSRVRIHDQPGVAPGSHHTRVEMAPEGQVIHRNDGLKTRITMGTALPEQSGGGTVQVGAADALNTRVQIHGPPAGEPVVDLSLVRDKSPTQIVKEMEKRAEQDQLSVQRAEKRFDQTQDELATAIDMLETWEEEQKELAVEAKRNQDEAIAAAVAVERAKLEAGEQHVERTQLEAERAQLEARRAELEAAQQKKALNAERTLLEKEKAALDGLEKAEAETAAETQPGAPPNVELVIGDDGAPKSAAPSSADSDVKTDPPPAEGD